jgi:hypothetical protein
MDSPLPLEHIATAVRLRASVHHVAGTAERGEVEDEVMPALRSGTGAEPTCVEAAAAPRAPEAAEQDAEGSCLDEQEVALQASVWDIAVLVGTGPFGPAGSAFAVLLLLINALAQV